MLVIIHGWSDSATSFDAIANRIADAKLGVDIATISLADYITLNDVVTFADLREAMHAAWIARGLSQAPRSVDVIVHSTGALVTRDWMTSKFSPATNPIRRLVMLAPANFGSPLASTGRSFLGRVVKGFHSDRPFQTGTQILKGLEMASPYSWQLALRDRFNAGESWYGPGRILCSVLVGTSGFTGISALANKPGTDGTVEAATANLNPLRVAADFSTDPQNPKWDIEACNGQTAFLRVAGENHKTITQGGQVDSTFARIVEALQVDDAGFAAHIAQWDAASAAALKVEEDAQNEYSEGYQNTVLHLADHLGQAVTDYLVEAYVPQGDNTDDRDSIDDLKTQFVQEKILTDAHPYGDDNSYRALQFNCSKLRQELVANGRYLELSVTAQPQLEEQSAGYQTFGYDDIGGILLDPKGMSTLFAPDRTVFVEITIRRMQQDIYTFRPPVVPVP